MLCAKQDQTGWKSHDLPAHLQTPTPDRLLNPLAKIFGPGDPSLQIRPAFLYTPELELISQGVLIQTSNTVRLLDAQTTKMQKIRPV